MFRDGGTIGIYATIYLPEFELEYKNQQLPFITVDNTIGTDTPGEWYYGWQKDNKHVPRHVKDRIKLAIDDHFRYQKYLHDIINSSLCLI